MLASRHARPSTRHCAKSATTSTLTHAGSIPTVTLLAHSCTGREATRADSSALPSVRRSAASSSSSSAPRQPLHVRRVSDGGPLLGGAGASEEGRFSSGPGSFPEGAGRARRPCGGGCGTSSTAAAGRAPPRPPGSAGRCCWVGWRRGESEPTAEAASDAAPEMDVPRASKLRPEAPGLSGCPSRRAPLDGRARGLLVRRRFPGPPWWGRTVPTTAVLLVRLHASNRCDWGVWAVSRGWPRVRARGSLFRGVLSVKSAWKREGVENKG